jgi:hypothetical protein
MIQFLNSQSLGSVCVGMVSISIAFAFLWARIPKKMLRYAVSIIFPLVLAHLIYWAPAWFGPGDRDQFAAWALIFIVPWFLTGAATSFVAVFLIRRYGPRHNNATMANQSTDPTP